jgi:hypothetical protein
MVRIKKALASLFAFNEDNEFTGFAAEWEAFI